MIYLDNNSEIQRVYIPRETLNIETVVPIPDDQFSDYYTKSEVNALIDGVEVDLSDYYTKSEIDSILGDINNLLASI